MQEKQIKLKTLLIISTIVLMFTNAVSYMLLLYKNREWKSVVTEESNNIYELTEALAEHVYYDGDTIPCNQDVKHYNRLGETLGNVNLGDVLRGDKVVALLSPNCCSTCAMDELEKLIELSKKIGSEKLVIVTDFALHKERSWTICFGKEGYYETDIEHLGLEGSPTRETPVVMLARNGRVKTSFIVGKQTRDFADGFHEYLVEYFNGKK